MTRLITRGAVISIVLLLLVAINAYSQEATGETVATFSTGGGIDLKIDAKTTYNGVLQPLSTWSLKNLQPYSDKFFNYDDIKPGDWGESTISLHVKNKDAWACMRFQNLKDKENGINEPEGEEDGDNSGELSENMEFFSWHDDGDNIFEKGEKPIFGTTTQSAVVTLNNKTYAITDAWTPKNPLKVGVTKYIGLQWCAGDMTVDIVNAIIMCDATAMTNDAQTDSMSVDISFHVVSSWNHAHWTCLPKYKGDNLCLAPLPEIKITNNASTTNNSNTSSNTGGNNAGGGGNVNTGTASSSRSTSNVVNNTSVDTSSKKKDEEKKEKDTKSRR